MAEWLKALVLKINVSKDTVSSNLTLPVLLIIGMFNFYKNKNSLKNKNNIKFVDNKESKIFFDPLLNKDKFYVKNLYILYIRSSLRGFHINISTVNGRVIKMFSTGKLGYKKAQRYNQIGLSSLVEDVLKFFRELDHKYRVNIVLKGYSPKRKRLVRLFFSSFLKKSILSIIDLTDLPYNGCRPKKLRRK